MARPTFEIRINPSPKRLARAMGPEFKKEFSDYRDAWRELLPLWAKGLEDNVHSQGRNLGEAWAPLAPSTIRRRSGRTPGIATGRMVARLGSPTRAKRSLTKSRLRVGPREKYAHIFHFGAKSRGQPERRFLAVSSNMRSDGVRVMDKHVRRQLHKLADRIDSLTRAS